MNTRRTATLPALEPIQVPKEDPVKQLDLPVKLQDFILQDAENDVRRLVQSLRKVESIGLIKGAWCKRFTFGKAQEVLSTIRFLRIELRRRERERESEAGH